MIEEKLRHQLRVAKIRAMRSPAISMNDSDLEELQEELKNRTNIQFSSIVCYEGVPIKANNFLAKGVILIYDEINNLSSFGCDFSIEQKKKKKKQSLSDGKSNNKNERRTF